jgi:hypothetical protein
MNDLNKECWGWTFKGGTLEKYIAADHPYVFKLLTFSHAIRAGSALATRDNNVVIVKLDKQRKITKIISIKDALRINKLIQL